MRTIFVINPKAGQGKNIEKLVENIKQTAKNLGKEIEIYITKKVNDAEKFVRNICQSDKNELSFFACGGDGTVNEVLNGAFGFNNASIGVIPIGTGNDFCRNFPEAGDFLNIESQLNAKKVCVDAIKYHGKIDGREQTRYCANMFNIGFDCNVADLTSKLKQKPFITGSFAYLLAVLIILIKKRGANLKIKLDNNIYNSGNLLLTSVANGGFCGGGINSNPNACIDDGIMDVNIINDVPRIKFLKLFPRYSDGSFLNLKGIDKIVKVVKCKKASIIPLDGKMRLCTDGEISNAESIEFEIINNAFNFLIPAKS